MTPTTPNGVAVKLLKGALPVGTFTTLTPPSPDGASLGTARSQLGGAGTQTLALAFGGTTGSFSAATEEFTGAETVAQTKTLTSS